ncbi:hypothetical protein P7C70_g5988, partial [Phenoliferia sp. Uapishka_3]
MADEGDSDALGSAGGSGGVSNLKKRWEQMSAAPSDGAGANGKSSSTVRVSAGTGAAGGGWMSRGAAAKEEGATQAGWNQLKPAIPGGSLSRHSSQSGEQRASLKPTIPRQRSSSGPSPSANALGEQADGSELTTSSRPSTPPRGLRPSLSNSDLMDSEGPVKGKSPPPLRPATRQREFPSSPSVSKTTTPAPSPPLPPLATRPAGPVAAQQSSRRGPPPPVSRKPQINIVHSPSPTSGPPTPSTVNKEESTEPPPSVRSLASKFASSQSSSLPKTSLQTPPVTPPHLFSEPGHYRSFSTPEHQSVSNMARLEAEQNPFDLPPPEFPPRRDSSASSSSDSGRLPPIPPRPLVKKSIIGAGPEPTKRPPPRLPTRIASSPSGFSLPLPAIETWSPAPTIDIITSPHELSQSPVSTRSIPPTRKVTPVPAPSPAARPPPLAPRPSVPTAPRPANSAPPSTLAADAPYVPPPPPSRLIAANERLAPQRPAIQASSGADDSSEDDEDGAGTSKSQEFPDATFANRRPPALRNRKPIHAPGQFYSFAVRGKRVVTAGEHHVYVWHPTHFSGAAQAVPLPVGDHKVPTIEFRAADEDSAADDGRFVWGGTREGHLFEVDTTQLCVSSLRERFHSHPVVAIFRVGRSMITLDDSGKLFIWGTFDGSQAAQLTSSPPKVQRVPEKQNFHAMVGNELWTSSGPILKPGVTGALARSPQIRVFDPTGKGSFTVTSKPLSTPESAGHIGSVTASAIVPSQPDHAYLGHDNGYVSVWDRNTYACLAVQRVSPYGITTLVGVDRYLWAGFRTGFIYVYDVQAEIWTVKKAWRAHTEAVSKIIIDSVSLWTDEALQIASSGADMMVQIWDGLLRDDWLDTELDLRQSEFCTYRTIRSLSISWNVDASKPQDLSGHINNYEFLQQCLSSAESPDIISFGFQEMIDLENKKLTAKTLILGKKKAEQKFTDTVSSSYRLWHDKLVQAVRLAMPPECPYSVVHVGDMVGLFSCIFVKTAECEALRDVALINVKTGMKGRYGNKGAILSRFVIDDTSICFINCHLAAGQSHRRERDHDLVQILEDKSAFSELASSSPGAYTAGGSGTSVFDHELVVISGDLNYRIDLRRDIVAKAVAENALSSLLAHDQLLKGLATNQSFRLRSFKEAPITFAPTYKYDPGTDEYDSSAKKRIPAWCDRVLWRSDRADKVTSLHYQRYECNVSDHKPISAALDLRVKSILPDKRAIVWKEVENAWFGVESQLLQSAREFYSGA